MAGYGRAARAVLGISEPLSPADAMAARPAASWMAEARTMLWGFMDLGTAEAGGLRMAGERPQGNKSKII